MSEITHGTHEFYRQRAQITKRLIQEKGFMALAVEADWPDAYRVNRYVCGASGDADAAEALSGFKRFPAWMWRNADVLDFVGWLRSYNDSLPVIATQVGFYGLDLYSLHASIVSKLFRTFQRQEHDAQIPDQFDAIIHFDQTRAVEPLEPTGEWEVGEPAETFPSGV